MKRVAVIGAGESGVGAALLAKKKNLEVIVSDYGIIQDKYKEELINNNIPFEEKGHTFERLETADVIVKSPGIPENSEVMRYFRLRHKKIISEIEFAYSYYDGRIIGITGSNGKTTTSKLCHHILKHSNKKIGLGGNIGYSFARMLTDDSGYDWVVLELSSFQLEEINEFRADVSVILNITPDHLDRYDYDFDKYAEAKWNLALSTQGDGLILLNSEDAASKELIDKKPPVSQYMFIDEDRIRSLVSKDSSARFETRLKGRHNMFNVSVAITIAQKLGLSDEEIQKALNDFKPIEHRMETVAKFKGVELINDSKATNVEASYVALEAIEGPLVWIAGGTDKGNDYSSLRSFVKDKAALIICLTEDDSKLRLAFEDLGIEMRSTKSVVDAVRMAIEHLDHGTVILSPACASFDLFNNYEDRGNKFKRAVAEYINASNK